MKYNKRDKERTSENNRPISSYVDCLNQLEDIGREQQNFRDGKRKRAIDNTDKSEQRFRN
jgi:hypothetical protein